VWVVQQARNLAWILQEGILKAKPSAAIATAGSSTSTVGQPDEVTEKGLTIQV